jgi:hypothetical protein
MKESDAGTFEIGLVMAGAVSAGAYTAGVVDYLVEALDQWEQAKARERTTKGDDTTKWDVPSHRVEIKVIAGASAGGICAAILAASLGWPIPPVKDASQPGPTRNKLYDAWVLQARIQDLLTTGDLETADAPIRSLLNSAALDAIAVGALAISDGWKQLPYVSPALQLILTTGNLRGVAYEVPFIGQAVPGHDMVLHADVARFYVRPIADASLEKLGIHRLDPAKPAHRGWGELEQSALATSAFPVGLAARVLGADVRAYRNRQWAIPNPVPGSGGNTVHYTYEPVLPKCLPADARASYRYVAVDGGVANNEPFDLARRVLSGNQFSNPRAGDKADRAVLMIDPFPDPVDCEKPYAAQDDLAGVIAGLATAFIDQARFKAEDLVLAQREDVFSRFLIAPIRRSALGKPAEPFPLASGSLGAFGGFLSRAFREHDFQLGRLNCQRFLQNSFMLYAENPLFNCWSQDSSAPVNRKYRALDVDPEERSRQRWFRNIIPTLEGTAKVPIDRPRWPELPAVELEELRRQIGQRADALVSRGRSLYAPGLLADWATWLAWHGVRGTLLDWISHKIEANLRERDLFHVA